ncbi:class I SAM-dependent methyltransferase [Umezawaea beigongshangensis]|uniref:class I SAM-dependent methyltransferase n=1 Tax=Umezawaea beigongshangensis TaxID=2780383 RepID=UPI0018F25969|nr:class I SAM-dependent methyltransferase [Umezawaea beigongshangensis]
MAFDHGSAYHRLVLRQVPAGARTALDVGCGTGALAGKLARRGLDVEALDVSADVLARARPHPGVRYRCADVTTADLGRHDVITCLASLHHVPFETVSRLRDALAPGGVLIVLGCPAGPAPVDLVAVPVNAVVRVAVALGERITGRELHEPMTAPVTPPEMTLAQVRRRAAELLPGSRVRRLLLWRYLLVAGAGRP